MNSKIINFIKNFSYTLSSNLITLAISTLVVLIIPKAIGVESYSYWQLYIFYTSYVGFLHFGWNDGVYLRYGGEEYNKLDRQLFFSQFIMLGIFQTIILILVFGFSYGNTDRFFIIQATAFCMLIVNLRGFLIYILQSTNKIKEYARVTIFDRLLYILLIILFLLSGGRNYKLIIIIDLLGKFISLIFAMIVCKRLVFLNIRYFKINFIETYTNISVGIKLMISNIASMLIVGVVRFGIERTWDITTFGKVSLTLSISNLLMLFINALGIIMFPVLRRTDKNSLPSIYIMMRDLLMAVMFGMLIFYYPAKEVLTIWLPDYAESLKYMALLFPLSVYEGKMALLVNTYFKTLRKEKLMLRINILVMSLSMLTTIVTTIAFKKLDIAVFSIVLLLMLRAVISEVAISKILNLYLLKDILLELTLTFAFIISGWYFDSILTLIIYLGFYLTYLVIKRKDLIVTKDKIKSIIFSKES